MPDRLAELLRQRALVQEHLAWLNQQIADAAEAAKGKGAGTAAPPRPSTPNATASAPPVSATAAPISSLAPHLSGSTTNALPADAEEILAKYRVEPTTVKQDVRKGCLLYFCAALLLIGAGLVGFYFLFGTRQ